MRLEFKILEVAELKKLGVGGTGDLPAILGKGAVMGNWSATSRTKCLSPGLCVWSPADAKGDRPGHTLAQGEE